MITIIRGFNQDSQRKNHIMGVTVESSLRIESQVCFQLVRAARCAEKTLIAPRLGHVKLTSAECLVLSALNQTSGVNPTFIGAATGLDKVKTSRTIKELVVKGLVSSARDSEDHRMLILKLTPRGKKLTTHLPGVAEQIDAFLLDILSAQEIARLNKILGKLIVACGNTTASDNEAGHE